MTIKSNILILTFLSILIFGLTNCSKENKPRKIKTATCNDTPPKDELCQAFFNRWFYNKVSNKCEQIGYSGCSQKGFETEKECEECKCR